METCDKCENPFPMECEGIPGLYREYPVFYGVGAEEVCETCYDKNKRVTCESCDQEFFKEDIEGDTCDACKIKGIYPDEDD